jgi:signal transduction histidine kinase
VSREQAEARRHGHGLSISRSIIEAHDGSFWATANADHGATFDFVLPAMR